MSVQAAVFVPCQSRPRHGHVSCPRPGAFAVPPSVR